MEYFLGQLSSIVFQIVMGILDFITSYFIGVFGLNMQTMKEYFPYVEKAGVVFGWAGYGLASIILLITALKGIFAFVTDDDEPIGVMIFRFIVALFGITYAPQIITLMLDIGKYPLQWLTEIETEMVDHGTIWSSLSVAVVEYITTSDASIFGEVASQYFNGATLSNKMILTFSGAGGGVGTILLLAIVLVVVCLIAHNYIKLLLEMTERYIVLAMLYFTSPVAFSMFASKPTARILKNWFWMVGTQIFLVLMNVWFLRAANSAIAQFMAAAPEHRGYTTTGGNMILWVFAIIAFLQAGQRIDNYLKDLGLTVARTGSGVANSCIGAVAMLANFGTRGARELSRGKFAPVGGQALGALDGFNSVTQKMKPQGAGGTVYTAKQQQAMLLARTGNSIPGPATDNMIQALQASVIPDNYSLKPGTGEVFNDTKTHTNRFGGTYINNDTGEELKIYSSTTPPKEGSALYTDSAPNLPEGFYTQADGVVGELGTLERGDTISLSDGMGEKTMEALGLEDCNVTNLGNGMYELTDDAGSTIGTLVSENVAGDYESVMQVASASAREGLNSWSFIEADREVTSEQQFIERFSGAKGIDDVATMVQAKEGIITYTDTQGNHSMLLDASRYEVNDKDAQIVHTNDTNNAYYKVAAKYNPSGSDTGRTDARNRRIFKPTIETKASYRKRGYTTYKNGHQVEV